MKLTQVDHCTWLDISKVIGVEINLMSRGNYNYYQVVLGIDAHNNLEQQTHNTSLEGVIPFIEFKSRDKAIKYLKDLGIELQIPEQLKDEYNKNLDIKEQTSFTTNNTSDVFLI